MLVPDLIDLCNMIRKNEKGLTGLMRLNLIVKVASLNPDPMKQKPQRAGHVKN